MYVNCILLYPLPIEFLYHHSITADPILLSCSLYTFMYVFGGSMCYYTVAFRNTDERLFKGVWPPSSNYTAKESQPRKDVKE